MYLSQDQDARKWRQIRFVISSPSAKRRTSHERPNVAGYLSRQSVTRSSVSKKNLVATYFTEPKMGQSYRLLGRPSAHILIRSMSVPKVSSARPPIFQQPTWSQSRHERTFCAKLFTSQRFRFVRFLSEYYSVTSPTQRSQRP